MVRKIFIISQERHIARFQMSHILFIFSLHIYEHLIGYSIYSKDLVNIGYYQFIFTPVTELHPHLQDKVLELPWLLEMD